MVLEAVLGECPNCGAAVYQWAAQKHADFHALLIAVAAVASGADENEMPADARRFIDAALARIGQDGG